MDQLDDLGNFHQPPYNLDNLQEIIKLVQDNNLDFGVAFDGDADRAVFIDDKGNVISGSMMTTMISDYLAKENDNLKVVHNVNVSPHALNLLTKKNIQLYRCKVGHSNIKKMMRDINADFGGEHSAHFYYKENFYADSGILTLLLFMKILSTQEEKVSHIIESYKFPPNSGEVNFVVDDVKESLKNIEAAFDIDFDYLDGLTCTTENYWFNIRGSNTEAKLRVNVEGESEKMIKEVLDAMVNLAKGGMTMIVVTHEMGFAKEVADEVIFMDEGMIVEKATTNEFFANPKSDRTKLFLSQIL
jgi:phosphomannomutase